MLGGSGEGVRDLSTLCWVRWVRCRGERSEHTVVGQVGQV